MKRTGTNVRRSARTCTACLVIALLQNSGSAQETAADGKLLEENAALRRRIAELEVSTSVAAKPAGMEQTTTDAAAPAEEDEDIYILSPFEVNTSRDYGYLRTNSVTATRIGTEIQKVPLNISILGEDFIKDTNLRDLNEVLRYTANSAGDEKMGILQPATSSTPSTNIAMRGFPVNSILRNGILRYNGFTFDNVERVEVIKGPAAVFFGQGYPGGVINYVTKRPLFDGPQTVVSYNYGGTGGRIGTQRATIDHNSVITDAVAMRIVAGWDNASGDKRFEKQNGYSVTPSIALIPFDSGILRINAEVERTERERNQDDFSWIWRDEYFEDYQNPRPELMAAAGVTTEAAYRARILTSYSNWMADVRRAAGDNYIPAFTRMKRGAYYTDIHGNRVYDEKFNYYGSGSFSKDDITTAQLTIELQPVEWVNVRYGFTHDDSAYTENKSYATPNADGMTFNTLNGLFTRDYFLESKDHQIDVVLSADLAGIKNKLLFGGVIRETTMTYTGTSTPNLTGSGQYPFFGNLPGAHSKPDEGYVSPVPPSMVGTFANNRQYVRNRSGTILSPVEIFTRYDPAVHPNPDLRRITEVDRGLVDRYRPKREDLYINYQGALLQDRVNVFGGWRHEKQLPNGGQLVDANPPWYTGGYNLVLTLDPENYPEYGFGTTGTYAKDQIRWYESDSYMAGVSVALTQQLTGYTSWSQTGVFNTGTIATFEEVDVRARATSLGLNPDTELARLESEGAYRQFKPEEGSNIEVGVKMDLFDQKFVGTFSVFRAERKNRKLDDITRTRAEPLNYTGPNMTGSYSRRVRWYGNEAHQRTEGAEFEAIWTPVRNYQALINGSWLWTAETVSDPSIPSDNVLHPIVFGTRLPYAPKYRFNVFNKYTFSGGRAKGLSLGLGARYASEMVISLSQDYNANAGGLTAGDYVVFDALVAYPWRLFGFDLTSTLNVTNVTDRNYSEGGANLAPPRTWTIGTSARF